MPFTYIRRAAAALALIATVGCTVHETSTPPLTGPSGLALSLTVNAIPDSISQDGGSQSSVKITAIGPDGRGLAALPLRLDMFVNGVAQDYGTLSARSVVTNGDGVATAVYTAPPSPVNGVFGTCSGLPGNCVSIVATATATNFATANPEQVQIRLVPTGVILPPASLPTAAFTMSPTQALANVPVTFDASNSKPGTGATSITSYSWNFGDGTPAATGRSVSHTFTTQQTFNVTLTVTNDRGLSASTSVPTSVGGVATPTVKVVFSPSAPSAGQTIVFNGDQSTAAPGHSLTVFGWNFGDGATASGSIASHAFAAAGTYNVVLSVADDTGQKGTQSVSVSVTSGGSGGGGATIAAFTFSPTAPVVNQQIVFNGSGSAAATGHSITKYFWDFGNLDQITSTTPSVPYKYTSTGTFTVTLTVTDDAGQTGKFSAPVTVASASAADLSADFSISPTDPTSGQLVTFNANLSVAPGATITAYDWDFGDGVIVNGQTSFVITHTYFTVTGNNFTPRLTVHDSLGRTNTNASHTVTVKAGTDPVARFTVSPSPATVGATVTFDGAASSASAPKTVASYQWDFGDGSPIVTTTAPTTVTTHAYSATGTYTIRLTVIDTAGLSAATTHTLLVQ
jgi:PKD repeat protein